LNFDRRDTTLKASLQTRIRVETALCVATAMLAIVTVFAHDWIEVVFGVDPDNGNGALEWAIVAALGLLAVAFGLLARRDRRRFAEVS
jgi:hypothetical protein